MRPDLPLRRSGLQVRRQPIRRASPRLRGAQMYSLVLMFMCLMTAISLSGSPAFEARHLLVNGARFTGEPVVRAIVGIDGSPNLFRLRTDRIASALVDLPAVQSVRVEVKLPDTITVTVVERQPRLVWVVGDQRFVVDDTGLLFGKVDEAGDPIDLPAGYTPPLPGGDRSPATSGQSGKPSATGSPAAATGSASDAATDTSTAATDGSTTGRTGRRAGQPVLAAPRPTPKPTPKKTAKPTPAPTPVPTPQPSPTTSLPAAPSLLPVPATDFAAAAGSALASLPAVYDRRTSDAGLSLGDVIDPIALDAGYRLAGLKPADVGSTAPGLYVVLDDFYGFTLNPGAGGWVAEFGFYTETLRKDTVIPEQVRDLRSMLLHYGEDHVAWAWLVADIAHNGLNSYLPR